MKFAMQDGGRSAGTDFRPDCVMNQELQRKYGLTNGNDYRHYLQNNAEKIMEDMRNKGSITKLCPVCEQSIAYKPLGNVESKQ